jgi:uncharacterized OB-fold protein
MSELRPDLAVAKPVRSAPEEDFVFVDAEWALKQSYRRDPLQAPFLAGLKSKTLFGVRDPARGLILFPPRSFSEESFTELKELVPVGPGGIIRTLTKVVPGGKEPRPPFLVVFVQLDGASSAAAGRLRGDDSDTADPLSLIGRRCKAFFKPEPEGAWTDFWYELDKGASA